MARRNPLASVGEAADELGGVERHGLEPVAAFDAVVLPFEGHAAWSSAMSRELGMASLHVLAYNLKRMIAILGVQPLIQAMRGACVPLRMKI
jgi:hypothetical protein